MLFKPTITLLLASVVAAAPAKTTPKQELRVWLNAHILTVIHEVRPSIDGVPVDVKDFGGPIGNVLVECLGECVPEYHCTLYDDNLTAFTTVSQEGGDLDPPRRVRQVSCASGPAPKPPKIITAIDPELPRPTP